MRQSFNLSGVFVFLSLLICQSLLLELLSSQNLALAMIAHFNKLSSQFLIFEVKEILVCHLTVEIVFVTVKVLESIVDNFSV